MKFCIASFVCLLVQCLFVALGAADCAPASGSITIRTSQDVSDVTNCTTFTGNIVVAADGPNNIILDGLSTVSGNIDVENVAKLRSLSSTSLEAVSSFTLNNLPELSNLSFPALKNFSALKWYNLPALEECTVATGALESEIQEITISNTSIKSLDWLVWPIGSQLNISTNANLKTFSIPYNAINAGSALSFIQNPALETLDLTQLSGIYGGLEISDNDGITQLSFEKLETIGGFVQLSGSFANISMPALTQINGALSVGSTDDISAFCENLASKKLNGHYDCAANSRKDLPSPSPSPNPTSTASGAPTSAISTSIHNSDSSENSKDGRVTNAMKIGIGISAFVFTILVLVAALFYFRRRSRAKVREITHKPKAVEAGSVELVEADAHTRTRGSVGPRELESPMIRFELADGREMQELAASVPQELDAWHGTSRLDTPASPAGSVTSVSSLNSATPLVRHELAA